MTRYLQVRIALEGSADQTVDTPIPPDRMVRVGRSSAADVVVRSTTISRIHCEFGADSTGGLFVQDAGSANGTFVAGRRIEGRRYLRDGDEVVVGAAVLRVGFKPQSPPVPPIGPPQVAAVAAMESDGPAETIAARSDGSDLPAMASRTRIELSGNRLTIGRDPSCDVVLDNLMLSRSHAVLQRKGSVWVAQDLSSTNGTFVNGRRLAGPQPLQAGDAVRVGPYAFHFHGSHLTPETPPGRAGVAITACGLTKEVRQPGAGKWLRLLDDVSFSVAPGEFVGLLGASGSGKSTLMDALNGRRPAAGTVFYNDVDLYAQFDACRVGIGYVPQELIFHDSLPVGDALRYTSRLRLSADVTTDEIEANIDRVLGVVGLADRRGTRIRDLSGGQKKRVSMAMELLCRPSVLFLDEVTSGLDLAVEREMMQLFRRVADDGVTVVCISHYVESLAQCDKLACLMRGRLVFYGTPADFKTHFGVLSISGVYDLEKARPAEEWEAAFRRSRHCVPPPSLRDRDPGGPASGAPPGPAAGRFGRQLSILTRRYVQLLCTDRTLPLILIAMAPMIAFLLCLLTSGGGADLANPSATTVDVRTYKRAQMVLTFGSVLTMMFLSLFGAIQEIVKELRVYHHERAVNLLIGPYVLSKLLPLTAIGIIQAALVVVVLNYFGGLAVGRPAEHFVILAGTSLAGTTLGLSLSAIASGRRDGREHQTGAATKAVVLMNVIVIPQVLFANAIMPLNGPSKAVAQCLVSAYWGYQAFDARIDATIPERFFSLPPGVPPDPRAQQLLTVSHTSSPGFCISVAMLYLQSALFLGVCPLALLRMDGPNVLRRILYSRRSRHEPASA